jgi:hypothetical protein
MHLTGNQCTTRNWKKKTSKLPQKLNLQPYHMTRPSPTVHSNGTLHCMLQLVANNLTGMSIPSDTWYCIVLDLKLTMTAAYLLL